MKTPSLLNKGNIVSTLFFLAAGIILLFGEIGTLSKPGLVAAGLGIVLCLANQPLMASGIGIISATISFLGQAMVGFCPFCTGAASAFAIAGIVTVLQVIPEKPMWGVIITPLLASILVMGFNCGVGQSVAQTTVVDSFGNTVSDSIPKLYFSPDCPSCTKALSYYIEQDPYGTNWHPVVVPKTKQNEGLKDLETKGYLGTVLTGDKSPSNLIPCVEVNKYAYSGTREVIEIGENLFREEK